MHRRKIIQRLLYLRNWELVNFFFLPACLYLVLSIRKTVHWQPYALGMFSICVVLAQGIFYWHLKLRSVRNHAVPLPSSAYQVFSFFNLADLFLFALYPLLFVLSRVTSLIDFQVSLWSNLLFLFAILEYVNYYHFQLSHDNLNDLRYLVTHRKIRRSPLWTDLQRIRERA